MKYNYIYGNGKKLARKNSSGTVNYMYTDHLGSVRVLGDPSTWMRNYYPFGEEYEALGTGNEYKFTGKEWDEESDLYYSWHRYYSPSLGRFTQVDPLNFISQEASPYLYANNGPLNKIDPSGLSYIWDPDLNCWVWSDYDLYCLPSVICEVDAKPKPSNNSQSTDHASGGSGISNTSVIVSGSSYTGRINERELQTRTQTEILEKHPELGGYALQQQVISSSIAVLYAGTIYLLPASSWLVAKLISMGGVVVQQATVVGKGFQYAYYRNPFLFNDLDSSVKCNN